MSTRPQGQKEVWVWLYREKIIFHAGVLCLLMLTFWFGFLSPRLAHLKGEKQILSERQVKLSGTEEAVRRLGDLDGLLKERRDQLRKLDTRTLQRGNEAAMVQVFTEATEALPVQVLDIHPEKVSLSNSSREPVPAWKKLGFEKHRLNVRLQCRYRTLGRLLEKLEAADLFFQLESLQADTVSVPAPNLNVEMTLAAYVYPVS